MLQLQALASACLSLDVPLLDVTMASGNVNRAAGDQAQYLRPLASQCLWLNWPLARAGDADRC